MSAAAGDTRRDGGAHAPGRGGVPAPAAPPAFRPSELLRMVPAVVWAITVLHTLALLGYSVLLPTYHGPDEPAHVDLVLMVGDEPLTWPGPGQRQVAARIHRSMHYLDFRGLPQRLPAGAAELRAERPSFDDLGPPEERTGSNNQLVQHPPGYYLLAAGWLAAAPSSDDWAFDRQVGYLRLLTVALIAPVPLLAYAVAVRLAACRPVGVAAAALTLVVPQLTHMGAVVNNDSLLILAGAVLTVPSLHVARGDRSLRTALWVGALLGAALFVKAFAFALVPWVGLAYLLGWWRRPAGAPWRPLLVAYLVALATGGWWWLRNLAIHGAVHVRGTVYATDEGFVPDLSTWVWQHFVPLLIGRWWGSFGWINTPLPYPLVYAAGALLAAGVVLAVVLRRHGPPGGRADAALLVAPTLLLLGLVVYAAWTTYARSGAVAGIQGRYLFAGVVGTLAAAAFGYGKLLGRFAAWLPLLALGAAAGMQWQAASLILYSYWGPPGGGFVESVHALLTWSPWSGRLVAALAAVALLCAAAVAGWLAADALGPRRASRADA